MGRFSDMKHYYDFHGNFNLTQVRFLSVLRLVIVFKTIRVDLDDLYIFFSGTKSLFLGLSDHAEQPPLQ